MVTIESGESIEPIKDALDKKPSTPESVRKTLDEAMPEINAQMEKLNMWNKDFPHELKLEDDDLQTRKGLTIQQLGFKESIRNAINIGARIQDTYIGICENPDSQILGSKKETQELQEDILQFRDLYAEIYRNLPENNI
jgi:hypothetical protein